MCTPPGGLFLPTLYGDTKPVFLEKMIQTQATSKYNYGF